MAKDGDHRFLDTQEVIGSGPITARGTIDLEEYKPLDVQVAIIQCTRTTDAQGNANYLTTAGAYGAGRPEIGQPDTDGISVWSMPLELDPEEEHREFAADRDGLETFGFILVRLEAGGFTGWIDQVKAVEQAAQPASA
jgi:hypothetical protein